MKRAIFIGLAILLLATLLGGYVVLKAIHYRVTISQSQIDAELKKRFPVRKQFLAIFELVYSNPEVTLLPQAQRVRVGLDAELNVKIKGQAKKLGGGATLTGRVDYRPRTQEFFLTDVQFERLTVAGIPPEHLQAVQSFASKAAEEYVRRFPIYRLNATNLKMATARMLLKDVQVRDREIVATLGL